MGESYQLLAKILAHPFKFVSAKSYPKSYHLVFFNVQPTIMNDSSFYATFFMVEIKKNLKKKKHQCKFWHDILYCLA